MEGIWPTASWWGHLTGDVARKCWGKDWVQVQKGLYCSMGTLGFVLTLCFLHKLETWFFSYGGEWSNWEFWGFFLKSCRMHEDRLRGQSALEGKRLTTTNVWRSIVAERSISATGTTIWSYIREGWMEQDCRADPCLLCCLCGPGLPSQWEQPRSPEGSYGVKAHLWELKESGRRFKLREP